jgi:hypothetical protein
MKFTLHYSGPLRAKGKPDHKHALRRAFHLQLVELWKHEPLSNMQSFKLAVDSSERKVGDKLSSLRSIGAFNFLPLATKDLKLIAALEVTMLRPEPAGRLVTEGGDIDNRLKTLFDAMSVPQADGLPRGVSPGTDESPFYTVLEATT